MTVDDYLDAAPEPQQTTLRKLRSMLRALLPDAEEGMSYGVPAFKINGKPVAGYAQFKAHCGFYPHSSSVLSRVETDLIAGHEVAKGTLRFSIEEPPSEALVRCVVELRMAELHL